MYNQKMRLKGITRGDYAGIVLMSPDEWAAKSDECTMLDRESMTKAIAIIAGDLRCMDNVWAMDIHKGIRCQQKNAS